MGRPFDLIFMNAFLSIISCASLAFVIGCSTTSQEQTASTPELPEGVRVLPEGAKWQEVFDASEGSTEWEAKTYEIGAEDVSFDVSLIDPIFPDMAGLPYSVVLQKDARGYPLEYRMFLRTGVCLDGTCKLLEATLFWDALGRFVRFEYPQGAPFTKTEHDPFTDAEYEKLHDFMADTRSILGTHPLSFFVVEPGKASDGDWDSETSATPPDAKAAVIEGAAYTTWVLWRWIHGDVVEQLLAKTNENLSDDYLVECLASDDSAFVQFALNHLQTQGLTDERLYLGCLEVLEERGQRDCILALDVLSTHNEDLTKLHADLIERIGVNGGSSRVLLNYFKKLNSADVTVWRQLAGQLDRMSEYKDIDITFGILRLRTVQDPEVRAQISRFLESGDPFLKKRAENFLQ